MSKRTRIKGWVIINDGEPVITTHEPHYYYIFHNNQKDIINNTGWVKSDEQLKKCEIYIEN